MKDLCPSVHLLERFHYSGAPATLGAHTTSCPTCRTTLEEMAISKKHFLNQYPFETFLRKLEARKTQKHSWSRWLEKLFLPSVRLRAAIAMASLAGLMTLLVWNHQPSDLGAKGGLRMGLYYVEHDSSLEKTPKKASDRMKIPAYSDLQFVYSTKKEGFLLLVGIEENGTVTPYLPKSGITSLPLEVAEKQPLPLAIRWEPTSSYERFFAIFSQEPLKIDEVKAVITKTLESRKTVEAIEQLPLPSSQFSILVYKK